VNGQSSVASNHRFKSIHHPPLPIHKPTHD
jgi:hypothetical protein